MTIWSIPQLWRWVTIAALIHQYRLTAQLLAQPQCAVEGRRVVIDAYSAQWNCRPRSTLP